MKTLSIARGIAGVLSLVGVTGLVGCGAETGAPEGQIGSTSEALTVNSGADAALQFYGSIKLEGIANNDVSPVSGSLELMVGGMDKSGTLSNKIQIYDAKNDTLDPLKNAGGTAITLPTALVEPIVAKVPNTTNVFMLGTGRTSRDGSPSADTYVLTLTLNGSSQITDAKLKKVGEGTVGGVVKDTGTPLSSGLVLSHKSVKQCGQSSDQKLIAGGGVDAAGSFQDMSTKSATDEIHVFTYAAGHDGGDSVWSVLQDGSSNQVLLRAQQGYPETLDADPSGHTKFFFMGGLNANNNALTTNGFLTVDVHCVATNAAGSPKKIAQATAMPDARARFSSIAISSTVNNSPSQGVNTTYDFAIAGGNNATITNGTAAPVAGYQFDVDGTTGGTQGIWRSSGNYQIARIFPRFVAVDSTPTAVKLVTGYVPRTNLEATDSYYNTTLLNDVFTASTAAWSNGTSFSSGEDRVGPFADLLTGSSTVAKVGPGTQHVNTTGNSAVNGTSDLQTVVTVP